MRIASALFVFGSFVTSAFAADMDADLRKHLEDIFSAANSQPPCEFVVKRDTMGSDQPTYLLAKNPVQLTRDPRNKVYEIKVVQYPEQGVTSIMQLLRADDPSGCHGKVFVVQNISGELQIGGYIGCKGDTRNDLRKSDGYGYEVRTKHTLGLMNKPRWEASHKKLFEQTEDIARKCTI
jgi:hypothetical protein